MLSALESHHHSTALVFGVPPVRSSANHDFLRLRRKGRWLPSSKKNSFTPHLRASADPPLLASTTAAESPRQATQHHDGSGRSGGGRGAGSFATVRTAMRWVACCGGNANGSGNGNGTYSVQLQQQQHHGATVSPREAVEQPQPLRQSLLEAETTAGDDSDPRSRLLPTGSEEDGEKTPRAPSANHHHYAQYSYQSSYSVQSPRGSAHGGECALGSGAGGGSSSVASSTGAVDARSSQATIQMAEKYGPMLLRPYKVVGFCCDPSETVRIG